MFELATDGGSKGGNGRSTLNDGVLYGPDLQ